MELICEICGKSGWHEPCSSIEAAKGELARALDLEMVRKHGAFGAFGLNSEASQSEYFRAKDLLARYLKRPVKADPADVLEGRGWWYFPEGWIGMLGFVVDLRFQIIFPLGSGLHALHGRSGRQAPWGAIEACLSGEVEGVRVSA